MECLGGILSDNLKDLVCLAVNQLRYPCCFNNFVEELEKEERNLIATRYDVKDRVDHAKKQTLKTAEIVHNWLEDADIGEADVKNLLIKAKSKKNCCFGHCPNWILRYHFGRKLANKKNELQELIKEGKPFVQLERVTTLPSETLYFPSDKYLKFESRESAFKQVMEAVKDEEVNKIGLYGMGGCGKTTLAEEVKKIAEAEHLFDKVLFVAVSSTVEVRRIQEKIASSLQYNFPVNEEKERATALCERLAEEKKILVILDDVWQRLDFGAIGIPLTEHHKGCKVLITTRSEDVCTLMDCQKKVQLQILTDVEAWELFQKQARISEDTSDSLKHLARQISDECKGLPVAIAAVAGSLKGKNEVIWKVALNKLRSSKPVNIEKGLTDPYKCLWLSYDTLDTEEAKSLFLLCSVFPEDFEIPTKDLIKLAIGLGVVGEVRSYDEAKSEVIAAKIKLVSSCLLMFDDDEECVKMHDLVRDVAHLIAKYENKVIKCQLDNDVTLEQSSIRYLWCKEFPNDLDCSNLEFLCIATKLEVLDEIFKRMGKLRVLHLINEAWKKQQLSTKSFKILANLRCLFLVGWELSDISFVRDTKKLQSLSLYKCSLPSFLDSQTGEFYKQLTKLKLLELIGCEMERNNYNVIGRISQLEELRIFNNNKEWHDWNEHTIELLKTFGVPQTLQCYGIILGNFNDYYAKKVMLSDEEILLLSCFHISNEAIKDLAKRAKVLQMGNIKGGAKNIIPHVFEMKEGSLNKLNEFGISDSDEIEYLVDMNNNSSEVETFFSQLLKLRILKMNNLRVLWDGCLLSWETFQKLKELRLQKCPKLTSLFTHTAGSFTLPNLTKLKVEECPKLSSLFSIFTAKSLISLEKLSISDCDDLKHIITPESGHKNEKKGMVVDDHDLQNVISMFPSLKSVHISCCENLEINFPLSWLPPEIKDFVDTTNSNYLSEVGTPFSELLDLRIENIKHLKVLWDEYLPRGTFQKLEKLHLQNCPELTSLFTQAIVTSPARSTIFQNLRQVEVSGCEKLKYVFSANTVRGLPQLKQLLIENCNELDQIIEDIFPSAPVMNNACAQHDHHEIIQESTSIPSASVVNHSPGAFILSGLTRLELLSCPKLSLLFMTSTAKTLTSLKELTIKYCHGLKYIVAREKSQENQKDDMVVDDHDLQSVNSIFLGLKKLHIVAFDLLQHIFPVSFVGHPTKLQDIRNKETPADLKYLFGQNNFEDNSCHLEPENVEIGRVSIVLEELNLEDLPQMTYIWVASKNSFNLQYLKTLTIVRCAKLEIIFPLSVLRCLPELESLEIRECKELKQILEQDLEEDKNLSNLLSRNGHFPKLKNLVVEKCDRLERVLSTYAATGLSNLKIRVDGCAELKELIECEHGKGQFSLSNLTSLELYLCPKLSSLFSVSTAKTLTSLKELTIKYCDDLKHIITHERVLENKKEDIVEDDHDLQGVISILCSLKTLTIIECAKLETIFPLSCLPELESVIIKECKELKQIMKQDLEEDKNLSNLLSPKPHFPKLRKLVVENWDKLKGVLPISTSIGLSNLEILIISGATELEELIGCQPGKG